MVVAETELIPRKKQSTVRHCASLNLSHEAVPTTSNGSISSSNINESKQYNYFGMLSSASENNQSQNVCANIRSKVIFCHSL